MDTAAGFVRNEYAYVRSVLFFVVQLRGYLHEYGAVPRCESERNDARREKKADAVGDKQGGIQQTR